MSEITFRRINGRIVPIRMESREKKKGALIAAAGVATGVAAGAKSSRLMHESAHAENAARGTAASIRKSQAKFVANGPLFEHAAINDGVKKLKVAARQLAVSKHLEKSAFKIRGAGLALAAGLTAAGVNKMVSKKEDSKVRDAAIGAGAAVATGAGYLAHSRGVGNRGFKAISYAIRKVLHK